MIISKEIKKAGEYLQKVRLSIGLSQRDFPKAVNEWLQKHGFKSRTCKRTIQQQEQGQRDVRGTTNAIKVGFANVTGADIKGFYTEEEAKALRFLAVLIIKSDTGIEVSYDSLCDTAKKQAIDKNQIIR